MMSGNVLTVKNKEEFRSWLAQNAATATECWVELKRGRPKEDGRFWYLDAVEQALCFGWIDSTLGMVNGVRVQRFTPRAKNTNWTELNKQRVRRLEQLGLMTDAGRAVFPDMHFTPNPEVVADICSAGVWQQFSAFPPLYQRVRLYNLAFTKKRSETEYKKALSHLISQTAMGKLYGEWNDYGRLPED